MKPCSIVLFACLLGVHVSAQSVLFTSNLNGEQVNPPFGAEGDPARSALTGSGSMTFTPGEGGSSPTLSYQLNLPGLDLDGSLTPANTLDDVTAIHIHIGSVGANGPHALNIWGLSGGQIREDDAQMTFDVGNYLISGVWDDSDESLTGPGGTRLPPDSVTLSSMTSQLLADGLYVQVHTGAFPSGELRGQITLVPEPSIAVFLLMGFAGLIVGQRVKPSFARV